MRDVLGIPSFGAARAPRNVPGSGMVRLALALALLLAIVGASPRVRAEASELPPEVGYNYGLQETPRIAGMGNALRAMSNSTEALHLNPANMAVARVYHVGASAQIWPEAGRQTYGLAIVDSIVSASGLAGGLAGSWVRQDPSGVDRSGFDIRFALAYPFSEHFFLGAAGRYLALSQNGYPRGVYSLGPSEASRGLRDEVIVKAITFDAGLTLKPSQEIAIALVGSNLTDPGHGFLPLMLGGGVGYGSDDFTIEGDVVGDFTTYEDTKVRAMLGGELLAGDHFPLRAGYRYDQGATSHTVTGGLGYLDTAYSLDLSIERTVAGDPVTAVVLGFKYHVESTGITPQGADF